MTPSSSRTLNRCDCRLAIRRGARSRARTFRFVETAARRLVVRARRGVRAFISRLAARYHQPDRAEDDPARRECAPHNLFTKHDPTQHDRDYRRNVGERARQHRRGVLLQPRIDGKADERDDHEQVREREQ